MVSVAPTPLLTGCILLACFSTTSATVAAAAARSGSSSIYDTSMLVRRVYRVVLLLLFVAILAVAILAAAICCCWLFVVPSLYTCHLTSWHALPAANILYVSRTNVQFNTRYTPLAVQSPLCGLLLTFLDSYGSARSRGRVPARRGKVPPVRSTGLSGVLRRILRSDKL